MAPTSTCTVREIHPPVYGDGINAQGSLAKEGLYFLVNTDSNQKTVTLLK